MLLRMWHVNSHNPCSGHCPLTPPECMYCTHLMGPPKGKAVRQHVTAQSTPLSVLMLFFTEIITLLVVETNRYYHDCLVNTDEKHHPQCDVTEAEMFVFLALTLQMGHTIQGRLEDEIGAAFLCILQTNNGTF